MSSMYDHVIQALQKWDIALKVQYTRKMLADIIALEYLVSDGALVPFAKTLPILYSLWNIVLGNP